MLGRMLAALLLPLIALSVQAEETIEIKKQFGVKYVTGGVTAEEQTLLKEVAPRFPVHLFFRVEGSERPIAGVKVTARDVRGDVVIQVQSEGPILMLDIPGGRYTIEAEYKGEKLSETKDLVGRRYLVLDYVFHTSS